jgi:hypothetical protein
LMEWRCIRNSFFFLVIYKARVFVPNKPLQPRIMFVSKARAYPTFHVLYTRIGSWPCPQHKTRLEKPARDKHISSPFVSYEENEVL